jgi:hypothetical protein
MQRQANELLPRVKVLVLGRAFLLGIPHLRDCAPHPLVPKDASRYTKFEIYCAIAHLIAITSGLIGHQVFTGDISEQLFSKVFR